VFIQRSALPPALKQAMNRLCKEGTWKRKDVMTAIDANRRALDNLTAR
jgi:hypothetical protein